MKKILIGASLLLSTLYVNADSLNLEIKVKENSGISNDFVNIPLKELRNCDEKKVVERRTIKKEKDIRYLKSITHTSIGTFVDTKKEYETRKEGFIIHYDICKTKKDYLLIEELSINQKELHISKDRITKVDLVSDTERKILLNMLVKPNTKEIVSRIVSPIKDIFFILDYKTIEKIEE